MRHLRLERVFLLLLLPSLLVGCGALTEPPPRIQLDFLFGEAAPAGEGFAVSGDAGALLVLGDYLAPCAAYSATAEARLLGGVLELRLRGRPLAPCGGDEVVTARYQAFVRTPGAVSGFRIVHEWPGTDWPSETVYEQAF
jgi:hypothetical protein